MKFFKDYGIQTDAHERYYKNQQGCIRQDNRDFDYFKLYEIAAPIRR